MPNYQHGGIVNAPRERIAFGASLAKPDRQNLTEHQAAIIKQMAQFEHQGIANDGEAVNGLPEEELKMRKAASPHHRNTQYSLTCEYWRQTSTVDEYRQIQHARRRIQNKATSSSMWKEEHMIIAHRIAEMEKRRVGTKFLDREVTASDEAKPLIESCVIM